MVSLNSVRREASIGHGEHGFLDVFVNESLDYGRYVLVQKLGLGSYAIVWKAWDSMEARFVAIKIGRCGDAYRSALLDEAERLGVTLEGKADRGVAFLEALRVFEVAGLHGVHVCIVLPLRGPTLQSILDMFAATKTIVPLELVLRWTAELATQLQDLHGRGFIHTDLKPDNVLFVEPFSLPQTTVTDPRQLGLKEFEDPMLELALAALHGLKDKQLRRAQKRVARLKASAANGTRDPTFFCLYASASNMQTLLGVLRTQHVMLADLSNAVHESDVDETSRKYNSTQYRCPEVLLWLPFGPASDLWSFGCLVFDMATTDVLFDPKRDPRGKYSRDDDHVAQMVELIGVPPPQVLKDHELAAFHGKVKPFFKLDFVDNPMRRIPLLKPWNIVSVLKDKYDFSDARSAVVSKLMTSVLTWNPDDRSLSSLLSSISFIRSKAATRIQTAWRRKRQVLRVLTSMWEFLDKQYMLCARALRISETICDDPKWSVGESRFFQWMEKNSGVIDKLEAKMRKLGWSRPVIDLTEEEPETRLVDVLRILL